MITEKDCPPIIIKFLLNIHKDGGFQEKRIRELLGKPETEESPSVGRMYSFESMFGSFWISKQTGNIVMYSAPDTDNDEGAIQIEELKAKQIAINFIKTLIPSFSENTFMENEPDTNGNCLTFDFEEVKKNEETSIFKNFISVTINGVSGEITDFSRSDLTFTRTTLPPVSEVQAKKTVEDYIKKYNGKILQIELIETPTETFKNARTVWSVVVAYHNEQFESQDRIEVDATTGEIIQPSYDENE